MRGGEIENPSLKREMAASSVNGLERSVEMFADVNKQENSTSSGGGGHTGEYDGMPGEEVRAVLTVHRSAVSPSEALVAGRWRAYAWAPAITLEPVGSRPLRKPPFEGRSDHNGRRCLFKRNVGEKLGRGQALRATYAVKPYIRTSGCAKGASTDAFKL